MERVGRVHLLHAAVELGQPAGADGLQGALEPGQPEHAVAEGGGGEVVGRVGLDQAKVPLQDGEAILAEVQSGVGGEAMRTHVRIVQLDEPARERGRL